MNTRIETMKDILRIKPDIIFDAIDEFHTYRVCVDIIMQDWGNFLLSSETDEFIKEKRNFISDADENPNWYDDGIVRMGRKLEEMSKNE